MSANATTPSVQVTDRVNLLSADRVRALLASDGLQRLISLIRRMITYLAGKLGVAVSYILPGPRQSANAVAAGDTPTSISAPTSGLAADMALVNAALEGGTAATPTLPIETDPVSVSQALTTAANASHGRDITLDLHVTGLPHDLAELKKTLLQYVDIIMTAGPTAYAAGDDSEKAAKIATRLGEEAARIRFLQRISAKQIALLVDHLRSDRLQYIGLSNDSIVGFLDEVRKNRARRNDIRPESTEGQLFAVLDANDAITQAFHSQVTAQVRLVGAFEAGIQENLKQAFVNASNRAQLLLDGREEMSGLSSREAGVLLPYHALTAAQHNRYELKTVNEYFEALLAKASVPALPEAPSPEAVVTETAPTLLETPTVTAPAAAPQATGIAKKSISGFGSVSSLQPDADDVVDQDFDTEGLVA